MKNFKLVGSFNNNLDVNLENNIEVVKVPFINSQGKLNYGLEKIYKKLIENNIIPKEDALDILLLATLVYLADTRISRELHSQDSWTREIELDLPVYNPEIFSKTIPIFEKMLCFLTGDRWTISISDREAFITENQEELIEKTSIDINTVTLFSGGMDSLISTINYLEQDKNVMLISHAGEGFTKKAQTNIISEFKDKYPDREIFYLDLWMVFKENFIENGGKENSTRSRSFLFIALGIFAISGLKNVNVLQVPENGFIALNVPLDELRLGAHSTRTTHPFYLNCWNELLDILNLNVSVINPYWNKTKGEMAVECMNKEFLKSVISKSFSCSSPSKVKWKKLPPPQHCGYCVPCIIRRAAMNKAFGINEDKTTYASESMEEIIKKHRDSEGIQLRSFQYAIKRIKENPSIADLLIYKTGPIKGSNEYIHELSDVYKRGLLEVDEFIECCLKEGV